MNLNNINHHSQAKLILNFKNKIENEFTFNDLYQKFENFLSFMEHPESGPILNEYDHFLVKYIANKSVQLTPFQFSTKKLALSKVFPISSFQYLCGLYPAYQLQDHFICHDFHDLLQSLENISKKAIAEFSSLFSQDDCLYLLKLSKYKKIPNIGEYILPQHFDNSVMTIILDVYESEDGMLEISLINNQRPFYLKRIDTPIGIFGNKSMKRFKQEATAHAVLNFKNTYDEKSFRYSLILFVLDQNALSEY